MTRAFLAALALAGALAVACAPNPPPRPDRGPPGDAAGFRGGLIAQPVGLLLSDFDADADRRITRAELEAGLDASWSELDADGSGAASPFEVADWMRAVMGSDTAVPGRIAFDRNADGQVTRDELAARLIEELARLDANQDGMVVRAELVRLVEPGMGPAGGPGARTFRLEPRGGGDQGQPPQGGPGEAGDAAE